ncbi:MAG: FAD-dependent oxidoreductase [Sphingomonas sp.]|nr:FAD-dependent oxidoreductase [Sphingomonas sp.]
MSGERAIRSIAVAGAGVVGLSAALAFARALPSAGITIIKSTPDPAALADTLPVAQAAGARLHALLGLDEEELVRAGIATHFLGTRFEDWSASGAPWWHVQGSYGKPAGAIPFDQIWARAHAAGKAQPYDRYAVGAALARVGKFVHPAADPNFVGSRFAYGLRLDPELYLEALRKQAETANVAFQEGDIERVELRSDGGVSGLRLSGGSRVEADLFVDCTGPSASVISAVDDSFEDWGNWLPFDRLSLGFAVGPDVPLPADRVRATPDGWVAEWPLRGRTMTGRLSRHAGISGDEDGIALTRGRRSRPWVRNVLALGDAATAMDPLHRLNLDMAHHLILLALELLPGRDFHPAETGEYNRRAEQVTRRVRDFLSVHYLRSGRSDGTWRDFAAAAPADSLARTFDQYEYRGRLPFHEDESVSRDSWTAVLLGLGVMPSELDPAAAAVSLDEALMAMEQLAREIEDIVQKLPSYAEYLGGMSAVPRR